MEVSFLSTVSFSFFRLFALKVLVHIILLNRAYAHVHAYTQMMTAKMAKEAAANAPTNSATNLSTVFQKSTTNSVAAPAVKTASSEDEEKGKPKKSIFYPPYTGYDQPTRDEGQLVMPQLQTRRSYSDTSFAATALVKSDNGEEEEGEEDFCSLHSYSTDTSAQQRSILKSQPLSQTESKFRQFLVDVDDMQISHRKSVREFCFTNFCIRVAYVGMVYSCCYFVVFADENSTPRASRPSLFYCIHTILHAQFNRLLSCLYIIFMDPFVKCETCFTLQIFRLYRLHRPELGIWTYLYRPLVLVLWDSSPLHSTLNHWLVRQSEIHPLGHE